mmetsp:Transcript_6158/g.10698  ORF Transcript_6158/g.10698 Transcript_6158/m.10698 type:complete len:1041 (+) Transcript_6158:19-3141(+)
MSYITQLLVAAAGADANARSQALAKLQELEAQPGLAVALLDVYADPQGPEQGRYLAILTCKNVIERRWQPRSGQSCTPEEKQLIKDKLMALLMRAMNGELPCLRELSTVVRRVCRFDFPLQWEALVRFLIAQLQECKQQVISHKALNLAIVLHDVMKEQATKRLLAARKAFFQVAKLLIEPVGEFWIAAFEAQRRVNDTEELWKMSRYVDGSFFILLVKGFPHLHEEQRGVQIITTAREKVLFLQQCFEKRPQLLSQSDFYVKNLKSVMKWWALLLNGHPLAFAQAHVAQVLHCSVTLLKNHATLRAGLAQNSQWESLMVSSVEILMHAFNTHAYCDEPQNGAAQESAELAELARTCHQQFAEFISHHPVAELADLVCAVALQLQPDDLQAWLAEPESELQGPNSQTELRLAGENCIRAMGNKTFQKSLVKYVGGRTLHEMACVNANNESLEVIVRRDTLLSLFALVQTQLQEDLPFHKLMSIFMPVANLVPQMTDRSMSMLLVFRICVAIKAWVAVIPDEAVLPVLQIVLSFLQDGRPKAIRLAALGPAQAVFRKFSDHEAWAQILTPMIDASLSLLASISDPESLWKCLNLVQLFLVEEAKSGTGYAVTERSLQYMLTLWRQPEGSELLICNALLDVLRALVLASCWTRRPRVPVSAPLFNTCLAVVSDCFTNFGRFATPITCPDTMLAALETDAVSAAGKLGDRGGAAITVFDSGLMLFLALLRVVEDDKAAQMLPLFPQLLGQAVQQPMDALPDTTLEILLEYAVLHMSPQFGNGQFGEKLGMLAQLCRQCFEAATEKRSFEMAFRLLQLLLGCPMPAVQLQPALELVQQLFQLWCTTCAAGGQPRYQPSLLVPIFSSWHNSHRQHFQEFARGMSPDTTPIALLLLTQSRSLRPLSMRVAAARSALTLVETTGGAADFWQTCMQHCQDMVVLAKKRGAGQPDLAQLLTMRSKISVPLPTTVRVHCELQCVVLPQNLHSGIRASLDDPSKEVVPVEWLFRCLAEVLKQLSAAQLVNAPAVVAMASPDVQAALRAAGA